MSIFQVKKYFRWGTLKLEPLQYLEVMPSDIPDCLMILRESDGASTIVSKKAFQNQVKIGGISEK